MSKPTKQQRRAQLARDISSIMMNPETPTILFNELADVISTLSYALDDKYWHSPEVLQRSLEAHVAKEEKRREAHADE